MRNTMKRLGRTALAGITACTMCFTMPGVHAEEAQEPEDGGTGKEETVYVITDASGEKQSVIVSDWLKNSEGRETITDESTLNDIRNVAGDESFERNADGTITWKADGNDIYYQGTSDAQLPVTVKISYELDGTEVSAEEIAGKAGHVRVRFDYTNNTVETIKVNGREETVKVPFAMITGVQIDQKKFSNIKVTNGKVISEGSGAFVVGAAFPGLRESLETGTLKEKLADTDIPDYIEIEADTTGFELGMIMTVAGNNLLSDLAFDGDADLSELTGSMDRLSEAAGELSEGTQKLKDGTGELREGTGKLKDGASELKDGTEKVKDGSLQLDEGAGKLEDGTDALKKGTGDLADGAGTLAEGTGTLDNGAKQLAAGAQSLTEGTAALASGAKQLADGTAQLSEGASDLKDGTAQAKAGTEQLAAGAASVADGTVQLQTGVNQLKQGIEQPGENGVSLKDGAAAMSDQIGAKIKELETQKQGLNALKKNVFREVGETSGNPNDLILAKEYQDVLNAAQALGQAQAQAAAAQKQGLMQKTIDRQKTTISDQEETIEALTEENVQLKAQAEETESQKTAETLAEPVTGESGAEAELKAKADALQAELDAANAERESLRKETESLQAENSRLSGELDAAYAQVSALNDQNAVLAAENESLRAQVSSADTAETHAEETAVTDETAETMLVLMGADNGTTDVETAAEELEKAKAAYNTAVSAMLGNSGTNDALIVSQIDETIAIIDQTIGDETSGLTALKTGADQLAQGINQVDAGVNQLVAGFAGDGTEANPGLVNGAAAVAKGASDLAAGAAALDEGAGKLKAGLDQTAAGAKTLSDGASKADSGANALKDGIDSLSTGTEKLAAGAGALKNGAEQLNGGAKELNDGAKTLHKGTGDLADGTAQLDTGAAELLNGAVQLDDGAVQLDDGALELLNGMAKFKAEGIDRLSEIFGDELEEVLGRLTALSDAGAGYRSFTGSSSGENDSVKFIFKTESVKAD